MLTALRDRKSVFKPTIRTLLHTHTRQTRKTQPSKFSLKRSPSRRVSRTYYGLTKRIRIRGVIFPLICHQFKVKIKSVGVSVLHTVNRLLGYKVITR